MPGNKIGVKRKARDTQNSTHHIIGETVMMISEGVSVKLPKLESPKRTIRGQRQLTSNVHPQPASLEDLEIPEEYNITNKGDLFLLFDSGPELQRILIFGTHQNTGMLEASQFWLADDTFKTAPTLFTQIYTIHSLRGWTKSLGRWSPASKLIFLTPKQDGKYLYENVGADPTSLPECSPHAYDHRF